MAFTEGLKLTTAGDPGVGKTSIISRFAFDSFTNDLDIGVELKLAGVYFYVYLTALLPYLCYTCMHVRSFQNYIVFS